MAVREAHRKVALAESDRDSTDPRLPDELIEHFVILSGTLTQESSVAGVAQALGTAALALTGAKRAAVCRCSEEGTVVCLWSHGFSAEQIDRIAATDGIKVGPVLLADLASWPLVRESKTIGLVLCGFEMPREWSSSEIDVALALSLHGAAALERSFLLEDAPNGRAEADQINARIHEALRLVEVESAQLRDAQTELEAQCVRFARTRRALGAVNVWTLALQHELQTERARLAAEQTRVLKALENVAAEDRRLGAVRETLGMQLSAADQALESESARLAAMCGAPVVEGCAPQAGADCKSPDDDDARLADVKRRVSEMEQAKPQEARGLGGARPAVSREAGADCKSPDDDARLADIKRWLSEMEREVREARGIRGATPAVSPDAQTTGAPPLDSPADTAARTAPESALETAQETPPPQEDRPTATSPFSYELGGPLPAPGAPEDLYPMLVERAAKLLRANGGPLSAEQQLTLLGRALDERDGHRAGYGERLARWSDAIAGLLGCGRDEITDIRRAALLHDLGKIGVSETILKTAGGLSDEERNIVRLAPIVAEQVLRPVKGMERVAAILRHRYERWDGKGYPDGLRGADIPLGARILAVTDAYGAMTTERKYRARVYWLDGVVELGRCAGNQFDPRVVEAFCIVLKCER
jgi:HD-GYP domain-containing protein (c-di-GMP phosphodiesterase class II)